MDSKTKYWLDLSEYDLITANAMYSSERYLYVGFMCHQSIEKILKAYFVNTKQETPPYIHNLTQLCRQIGLFSDLSEGQKDFLYTLQPLNIEARYPSYKEKLLKSLNKENCSELLNKTKEFHQWVKQKL